MISLLCVKFQINFPLSSTKPSNNNTTCPRGAWFLDKHLKHLCFYWYLCKHTISQILSMRMYDLGNGLRKKNIHSSCWKIRGGGETRHLSPSLQAFCYTGKVFGYKGSTHVTQHALICPCVTGLPPPIKSSNTIIMHIDDFMYIELWQKSDHAWVLIWPKEDVSGTCLTDMFIVLIFWRTGSKRRRGLWEVLGLFHKHDSDSAWQPSMAGIFIFYPVNPLQQKSPVV